MRFGCFIGNVICFRLLVLVCFAVLLGTSMEQKSGGFENVVTTKVKHSPLLPKSRIFVYLPDFHKSGGPAHFHQLHSNLNQLGFDSYFYYVNPHYVDKHMKNLTFFDPTALQGRDIVVLPANWQTYMTKEEERQLQQSGARGVVLVTGVSYPQQERLLSLANYTQGWAVPFAHSHYTHLTYQLPWDAKKFILWAPVEPWVIREYEKYEIEKREHKQPLKENHIAIDPDAKTGIMLPDMANHTVLFNLSRVEIIQLFKRSKLIYDAYLNGHEHMPREAILFDCLPVLTMADNGNDRVDFPFSRKFLIDELNKKMGSGIMEGMLREYDNILPHFSIFKKSVLDRPKIFMNNIRSTFVSRRYQFKIDAPTYINEGYALIAALRILTSFPLASVQISVGKGGVLRFMRRGGRLTKRLVELGLTDDFGGKIYHSLRVTGDDLSPTNYFGIHGDVLVYMQKPFYIYNAEKFSEYVEDMLAANACDTSFPTDSEEAFVEIKLVRKDDKDVSCTDVVGVDQTPLSGFLLMEIFGAKMNSAIVRELGERKQKDLCVDICSLSKLHTWQSTGIFPRVFQKGMNDRAADDSWYASSDIEGGIFEEESMLDLVDYSAYPAPYYGLCDEYCSF